MLAHGLFAVITPIRFRRPDNLESMARQIAVVGTAAVGMTVIIISTEIDLSVGSAIVLAAMVVFWGGGRFHPGHNRGGLDHEGHQIGVRASGNSQLHDKMVTGGIIIVTVALDRLRHRKVD